MRALTFTVVTGNSCAHWYFTFVPVALLTMVNVGFPWKTMPGATTPPGATEIFFASTLTESAKTLYIKQKLFVCLSISLLIYMFQINLFNVLRLYKCVSCGCIVQNWTFLFISACVCVLVRAYVYIHKSVVYCTRVPGCPSASYPGYPCLFAYLSKLYLNNVS